MPFIYPPLSDPALEIRLLTIRPGSFESPVSCALKNVRFADSPKYETISYCWGTAVERTMMVVNGVSVSVPASSAAAIRRVRKTDTFRKIWIDAVCIDQDNIDERNLHVAAKRSVYANSTGNLVYLGESEYDIKADIAVNAVYEEAKAETDDFANLMDMFWGATGVRRFSDTPLQTSVDFDAILALMSSKWFSRLWVLQEVFAAPKNTCFFGSVTIDLNVVSMASLWLTYKAHHIPDMTKNSLGLVNGGYLWELTDPLRGHWREGVNTPSALLMAKKFLTSQPEDKVFGILGILSCTQANAAIPKLLAPDYRKDVQAVYRDATRSAIEDSPEHLQLLLSQISHRTDQELENTDWASWTPKWDRLLDDDQDPVVLNHALFHAADGMPYQPAEHVPDPRTLHAVGITIGRVEQTTSTIHFWGYNDIKNSQRWLAEAREVAEGCESSTQGDTPYVLIAGANYAREPATPYEIERFGAYQSFIASNKDSLPELHNPYMSEQDRLASKFAYAFNQACNYRRVFRTNDGRLGVGPQITKAGDVVVVLCGSNVPYVLRQHESNYRLVGECYVHGIMHGEAVHQHKAQDQMGQAFNIR